jgi:ribosome-binding factor A
MRPFARADRVGHLMMEALADLLVRQIKDPRLEKVTVTGAKLTADLKLARIFFVVSGGPPSQAEAMEGFAKARGFIRRQLASRLGLRYMPEIVFTYDGSLDYGEHIDHLLKAIAKEDGSDH